MRPSQTFHALEDLRNLFVSPLYRKGVELSSQDRETVLEVYQQWLLLMVDLGYLQHGSLLRDAQRLLSDMTQADVLDLNNAFAELLALVRMQEIRGFKALCRKISTHLYSLIREDITKIAVGDVYAAKRLIQLFSYTSHMSLRDIDLTQQCLDDYLRIEEGIPFEFRESTLLALNKIIVRWMKSFDPCQIHFNHGPRGVAGHGRTTLRNKYKDLTSDMLIDYVFRDTWWVPFGIRSTLDRISEVVFVPKNYKTFRTISMEPSTLQYLQQGIWHEVDRVVSDDWYLRKHISFHDQSRNQRLAREGSISRQYATIDLSAASDSVSYDLVKRVFRGTKLLRFIMATRSRRALLPNGQLITLRKFAPMGSALCFPIETIIFAAICQHVTRAWDTSENFSVFGDDIIVPTHRVGDTMRVLESLGFRVNREKSFYRRDCWFRESCGGEYCDGFDVTPMRVSRKYNHCQRDVQTIGLIDSANEAYDRNYRNLRGFFLAKLRNYGQKPLFAPTCVKGDNYTNYHVKHRWNRHLQRIECKITDFATISVGKSDESLRYRHWLESTNSRETIGDGFLSNITRQIPVRKDRWACKPYEVSDQHFIDSMLQRRGK